MAEPNTNQPTEPERSATETETDVSSTSSGGDSGPQDRSANQDVDGQNVGPGETPEVYVEPPLTKAQPPIFYIPLPSPGDPVPLPLIPSKAFVVGPPLGNPVQPLPAVSKSVFRLSDLATQSTIVDEQTQPQTDSDVDITAIPVRSVNQDVDIPGPTQPTMGKPIPVYSRPRRIVKSCIDVDSNTPVPAPGRIIWSSTDDEEVFPKSVFAVNQFPPQFPHVAFGAYVSAVPGSVPKSRGIPMAIPPPITGWRAPGIPNPPPPPAVHVGPTISGHESSQGSPFQTPSSIQFTTPRVIRGPQPVDASTGLQPRALFQTQTDQPNQAVVETDERQGVRPFLSSSASSSHQPAAPDVSEPVVALEIQTMMSCIQTAVNDGPEPNQEPANQEPEDEPQVPPIRWPLSWDQCEGCIVLVGGFSNAGKSSLVEAVSSAFGLKRWKDHPNKKVWITNETGQERNSKRQMLHYTNDPFRMANNEINHSGLNQSIDTMSSKFKHCVIFVEGHRILDNEDLVNRSSMYVWIHTPSQTRKLRSPSCKGKTVEEWNAQLKEETAYFNHHENVLQKLPFTILDGLQTKAFNAMVVMALMGLHSKDLEHSRVVCYREFELPNPEDADADNQRLREHSKHDPKQFSAIFKSKISRPCA